MSRFSLFGGGNSRFVDDSSKRELLPTLKLEADKEVYRPGDPVIVTIEISNTSSAYSFLVEKLSFELKGIEKLDTQWFAKQKPLPGPKQKRGWLLEQCSYESWPSNFIVLTVGLSCLFSFQVNMLFWTVQQQPWFQIRLFLLALANHVCQILH